MDPINEYDLLNLVAEIYSKNIEVIESGTERIPTDTKSLTEEERKDVDKLLEKIEEDDDVINVYHTMAEEE